MKPWYFAELCRCVKTDLAVYPSVSHLDSTYVLDVQVLSQVLSVAVSKACHFFVYFSTVTNFCLSRLQHKLEFNGKVCLCTA